MVPMSFIVYKGLFFACYMGDFYRNPKGIFIVEISNNKAKNIKGIFNITILKRKQ